MHRIGILGAAGIAPRAIIEPARRRDDVLIHAVASRRVGAAAAYAKVHDIAVSYDGYEALLADPDIDLIYNALPPSEHARWSIAALEAGKDVLCEKPFAMNAAEARRMVQVAQHTGKRLIEAFHDCFHPAFLHLLWLKESGAMGAVRSIKAEFQTTIPYDPKSIRHDPAAGGGALMDLGCYPVHWVRSFLGENPDLVVAASGTRNPLGVDESITATLRFPSGLFADVSCSMAPDTPYHALLTIIAENGSVELQNPVLAHQGHSIRERLNGKFHEYTMGGGTTFDYQLEAVVRVLAGKDEQVTGGLDAIGNMQAIDAIYAKAGFVRAA